MATVVFPSALDGEWIEKQRERRHSSPLAIDLKRWHDTLLFGEARLLRWLASLENTEVELWLGHELPAALDPNATVTDIVRDRLAMYILSAFSTSILSSRATQLKDQIASIHQTRLRETEFSGAIGFGREQALLAIDRVGAPSYAGFSEHQLDYVKTESRVREMIKALGLSRGPAARVDQVASFAAEAIENTTNHALLSLGPSPTKIDGVRFLQIRRINVDPRTAQICSPSQSGPTFSYLQRFAHLARAGGKSSLRLVEVSVADCGDGIASCLYGDRDIVHGPISAELEVTLRAMRRGQSSKPPTEHGRGQGLPNAIGAARESGGLLSLHTGRLELTLDTTADAPSGQDGWHIAERPLAPGTSFSMIVPWDAL